MHDWQTLHVWRPTLGHLYRFDRVDTSRYSIYAMACTVAGGHQLFIDCILDVLRHLCDVLSLQGGILNKRWQCPAIAVPKAQLTILVMTPRVHSACTAAQRDDVPIFTAMAGPIKENQQKQPRECRSCWSSPEVDCFRHCHPSSALCDPAFSVGKRSRQLPVRRSIRS